MRNLIDKNEDLLKVLAAFITAQLAGVLLSVLFVLFGSGFADYLTINIICVLGVNAVTYLLFSKGVRLPERAAEYSRLEPFAFLAAGVLLACLARMLTNPLLFPDGGNGGISSAGTVTLMYALYTILLAPITEEIAFRGAVLTMLHKRGDIAAALISALAFALYHQSLTQFLYTFVLGFFLALLARRSGRLLPCILVHMANNALTVAVSLYEPLGALVNIALPVLGAVSLLWLIKTNRIFSRK